MARCEIYAGICGFRTEVEATSADGQHVTLKITSACPDVLRVAKKLNGVELDAYEEIGPCSQPGSIYDTKVMAICGHLPHVACAVPSGICKAIEVAASLALPRDAHIKVFRDEPEKEA
ncbi:hypothetical protein HQ560_06905 [bacterium]|nr:hypothetical protein [bacterium]